ncbi:effector-associated constant component EACC1 [Yinghuangia sp. YIM S09857]|uniref:effector-associated constant component EACC1 n=1 Tax=Yinghuangia sp. YIM S09857 TaxID=3436929 RepID=UPI003F538612
MEKTMTRYDVRLLDGDVDDFVQLLKWLQGDDQLARHAVVSRADETAKPGEMGTALEVVQLVVDSGFQTLNLVMTCALWRQSRYRPPVVTIEHNGVRVTVDSSDADAVARIAEALRGS